MRTIDMCGSDRVLAMYTEKGYSLRRKDIPGVEYGTRVLEDYAGEGLRRTVMADAAHSGSILLATDDKERDRIVYKDERFATRHEDGYDGMVTAEPGILMCLSTADCAPVYLYDPVKQVASLVHSGWRGTCSTVSVNAIKVMEQHFGTDPENIRVAIGPCICADCYEVTGELKDYFLNSFSEDEVNSFLTGRGDGKYSLDLRKAITISVVNAGVSPDNIIDTGICTYETEEYPSYRRAGFSQGHLLAGIVIRQKNRL